MTPFEFWATGIGGALIGFGIGVWTYWFMFRRKRTIDPSTINAMAKAISKGFQWAHKEELKQKAKGRKRK